MKTDDLIALLSDDLPAVRSAGARRILFLGFAAGAAATVILLAVGLRFRHDLAVALGGWAFWTKLSYSALLAGLGFWIVLRLSRPGADARLPARGIAVPVMLLGAVALAQLFAPQADVRDLVMGRTAKVCSSLILLLSLPIFAAVIVAMRRLAPTHLAGAGAGAGFLAGASSAAIYCLHCPETAAPFVLIWYSLGILLSTLLGAASGRLLLRW